MDTYELIRSRRKTLALELTREGRLIVRAPLRISRREIDAFVEKHKDWIVRHLAKQAARPTLPPPDAPETQALKTQAQAVLPERVAHWSAIMGVHPTGLRITTARKRYGSCSSKGSLCFSCYLMCCPEEAVELVVVHELCHLRDEPRPRLLRAAGAIPAGLEGAEKAAELEKHGKCHPMRSKKAEADGLRFLHTYIPYNAITRNH